MLEFIKGLFSKKEKAVAREFYAIDQQELAWAANKIRANKDMYIEYCAANNVQDWRTIAMLHYVVFRLNYGKLDILRPAPLDSYKNHYYYEAGLKVYVSLEA